MARLVIGLLAAAVLAQAGSASHAQTEEELGYAAQIGEAQSEARAAEAELAAARSAGDPVIARYERMGARLDRLAAELGDAQRRAVRADQAVQDVPVTLTARRDALADRLIRLYQGNGDPDEIARLEAARADVERQIVAARSAGGPARLRRLQADRDAQRLYDEVQSLRAEFQALAYEYDAARSRIEAAQGRLARARETLHLAQDNARIFLADTAPPILKRVTVRTGQDTVYDASWVEPAAALEEQLRLARYLHEDLSRSTARRTEAVQEWSEILMRDQTEANRLLDAYVNMMGGSHDGLLGYVERGLDAISGGVLGAVIASGSHTWKKIGVELADAAFSVGMNMRSGLPPHAAVMTEAIFQITDVAARAITGEPKNPGWDVTAMPMAGDTVGSYGAPVSAAEEQAFLQNLSAGQLRATLMALHGQVSDRLDADDYRDRLIAEHGARSLAAAFSSATVYATPPDPALFRREMTLEAGGRWLWAQFESPSGVVKSVIIEGIFQDEPDLGPAVLAGLAQSAVRDGLLSALEAQRLAAWEAYINADVEARLTAALLRHEGRARRLELRIQSLLAAEVIPALEAELAGTQGRRRLEIATNAQIEGRRADLTLTFSAPVSLGAATLEGEPLELQGEAAVWTARFDPRDFAGGQARLVVEADHAAVTGRSLDDPATIAVWDPVNSVMTGYEPVADAHHAFTLDPPAGAAFALILDTSGSMAPDDGADPATSRFAQAQAALRDLLGSGQIRRGDQAALFTFDGGCGALQAAPFTTDLTEVAAAVDAAAPNGNTPLAASILAAADSLSARNVERGVVIAVTDGGEGCGGSVAQAVAEAGARIDQVRQRRIP